MLLLASASPRRSEILRSLGIPFRVRVTQVEERLAEGEDAPAAVCRLAREKALEAQAREPGVPVLAADTLVFLDGQIFGKPADDADARRMLERLSGRTHRVATGLCLLDGETSRLRCEISEVTFAPMSGREIAWYLATGEPAGKAGAYAVQGLGARFVVDVRGSYSNVVGLPARAVYDMLTEARLSPLALPDVPAGSGIP